MAKANLELINALRETADRLADGAEYRWTHMGSCNCGHLVQTLTDLPKAEIHAIALKKAGDWSQQAIDYCPTSGYPMDHLIQTVLDVGLSLDDIRDLEKLSARAVLLRFPLGSRDLDHRDRAHVVRYMRAWADLLEERLIAQLAESGEARALASKHSAKSNLEEPTSILV